MITAAQIDTDFRGARQEKLDAYVSELVAAVRKKVTSATVRDALFANGEEGKIKLHWWVPDGYDKRAIYDAASQQLREYIDSVVSRDDYETYFKYRSSATFYLRRHEPRFESGQCALVALSRAVCALPGVADITDFFAQARRYDELHNAQ